MLLALVALRWIINNLKQKYMRTYIWCLPSPIKKLALLRQKEAGFIEDENKPLQTLNFEGVFNWHNTPEGFDFWSDIDIREYQCFKDKYGIDGMKHGSFCASAGN